VANFDAATAITLESSSGTTKEWLGFLTKEWSIGQIPNGGYSAAVALRALLEHSGCEAPLSLTNHYYRPTIAGAPVTIRTEILRAGRTTTHADALLIQDDKVRLRCVAVLGALPGDDTILHTPAPTIPDPLDCPERDPKSQGLNMTLLESLEIRLHTDPEVDTPRRAHIDGWIRFRDGRPNDPLALCLFADSFPPAIISALPGTGWVPTIELTSHVRAAAAPGWIRGEVRTENVRGGTIVENVRLWDETDTLVIEARQLALLRN
jgi:acyl-coenzyme A thioesterase PaaI-like protein